MQVIVDDSDSIELCRNIGTPSCRGWMSPRHKTRAIVENLFLFFFFLFETVRRVFSQAGRVSVLNERATLTFILD